jgi:hypothetical protein
VAQTALQVKDAALATKSVDAWSLTPSTSLRQAAVIGDPSVDAAVAAVKNGQVDPAAYGLVVRRPALALPHHWVADGTANDIKVVKASAGVVHLVTGFNNTTYPVFIHFFDKATTPNPASDPVVWAVGIQAGEPCNVAPPPGVYFTAGISYAIVKGIADTNNTRVGASACLIDIFKE